MNATVQAALYAFNASMELVVASAIGVECRSTAASDSPSCVRIVLAIRVKAPSTSSFRAACTWSAARMSPEPQALARNPSTY